MKDWYTPKCHTYEVSQLNFATVAIVAITSVVLKCHIFHNDNCCTHLTTFHSHKEVICCTHSCSTKVSLFATMVKSMLTCSLIHLEENKSF